MLSLRHLVTSQSIISLLLLGLLLVVSAGAGYWYFKARLAGGSTSVSIHNPALDRQIYTTTQDEGRDVVLLSGTLLSASKVTTDNTTVPQQVMLDIQSSANPTARFRVSLGAAKRAAQVRYPLRTNQPDQLIAQTLPAGELASQLQPGEKIEAVLGFPPDQPEIQNSFMRELAQFSQNVASGEKLDPFDIHYFRLVRLHRYD
jgi:hypothetical protein